MARRTNVAIPPVPAALSGNTADDIRIIHTFLLDFRQQLIVASGIVKRMDQIAELETLDFAVSSSPTQAEIEKIKSLCNQIITKARGE